MNLREILKLSEEQNISGNDYPFYGVNKDKDFIPTAATTDGLDKKKYKIIRKDKFVYSGMQTGRDVCIRFALYSHEAPLLLSPAYSILKVSKDKILPEYVFLNFLTFEKDRLGWFYSDGSVRANLDLSRFLDIDIPMPSLDIQRQYANVYNTLRKLSEQNEAIVKPLMDYCTGFMAKLLTKYKRVEIGDILEECVELNGSKYNVDRVIGLSTSKSLIPTKAKMEGVALKGYKVFKNNTIAYVSDTSRRGEKVSMGYNNSEEDYLVSSITTIFKSKDESILNTNFLFLYLCRESFDRYARYNSWGSARETFDWSEMCRVKIPLPPIEVQESIVAIYKCAEKARSIAERAREEMKRICPAMIQRAAHQ